MNLRASAAFWFLGIIWGTNFIFMKWGTDLITPSQLVFVRVAAGLIPIFLYSMKRQDLKKSHLAHSHHFLFMATLSTVVYYYGFAKGASLLPSGIAGAVSGAIPLFAFVTALIFLKEEQLTHRKLFAVLLGFTGVVGLAKPWQASQASASVEGVIYMVVGSLCAGCAFAYTKKYIAPLKIPPSALATYQMGFALLILIFVTEFRGMELLATKRTAFLGVTFGLGVLGTGLAYITYYYIVDKLGAVTASSATYIPPIVALLIGALFANEKIYLVDYVATGFIFAGVLILNAKTNIKKAKNAKSWQVRHPSQAEPSPKRL